MLDNRANAPDDKNVWIPFDVKCIVYGLVIEKKRSWYFVKQYYFLSFISFVLFSELTRTLFGLVIRSEVSVDKRK